jgi:hypothetical protein
VGYVKFDTSELDDLADALEASLDRVLDVTARTTARSALAIKKGAQNYIIAQTTTTFTVHYPHSISYDVTEDGTTIEAEIGPDKARRGRQGALGNILEFGTSRNAPIPHLLPAFEDELPKYLNALGRFVGDVVFADVGRLDSTPMSDEGGL